MDELSIYFDFLDSQKLSRLTLAEGKFHFHFCFITN